ncbi:uncharacterized protein LOC124270575 isoform X3 [Haliotis rubra]|uniref:uncharacterized protein LOC124270575 isoform X3 n=1 Tax=Haliotis rubra TaxID=36100 RepID=UPI001EE51E63|nr:uncharacterized protein LOC124270575 isoform X3 [Haliotis rubra]
MSATMFMAWRVICLAACLLQTAVLMAGVFMGGVAAGAVIVILVGLAVYVLVIRRRYDLTAKKQGDTPASVEHPTYSGLLAEADANNYAIIEQTSRSQEDTTHGPTATPDYQNI